MAAKNIEELAKEIQNHIRDIIKAVAEDVQKDIDEAIGQYYDEYDPKRYRRTYQLEDCCTVSAPQIVKNEIKIQVYLDINSLHYQTKGADPYKTVVAADVGLHGGWDVYNEGIIPWNDIKHKPEQLTGSVYGGTSIWTDPIERMIENGLIEQWFIQHALERGLKLKKI